MSHHTGDERGFGGAVPETAIGLGDLMKELHESTKQHQLGATGEFPNGKLVEHDEGEIRFAVAHDPRTGTVLINFGKPVASLGMTREQAIGLADLLRKHAEA